MIQLPYEKGYYVYLLLCENDSYYCGYTTSLHRRFELHKQGKGAKYTRANPPICICYFETLDTMSLALKREYEIKQLRHDEKRQMAACFLHKNEDE